MRFKGLFFRARYRMGIFLGVAKIVKYFLGVLGIPDIFLGEQWVLGQSLRMEKEYPPPPPWALSIYLSSCWLD